MSRILTCILALSLALPAGAAAGQTAPDAAPSSPPPPSDEAVSAETPTSAPGGKFPWLETPPPSPLAATPPSVPGRLAIQATQGTSGGPPVGAADVEVQLVHRGAVVHTVESRLDEHGVLVLEDLPIDMGVLPVVSVSYADVTYRQTGGVMDPAHPQQRLDVDCYEVTVEVPEWAVQMRHMMVAPVPAGLRVTEMLVIENPGDRTWLGAVGDAPSRKTAEGEPRPETTVVDLPRGSTEVALGKGFHDWCCTTLVESRLVNHLPLMPKTTEMSFSYVVPVQDGLADLKITAPAQVEQTMVIVPDGLLTESMSGLQLGGTQQIGETTVRYYVSGEQQPGQSARIVLTGLVPGAGPASAGRDTVGLAKIVAAIGIGLLVIVGAALLLSKSPRPAAEG